MRADTLIDRRVAEAAAGTNPAVIARMKSGWARFLLDMAASGDALLEVTAP